MAKQKKTEDRHCASYMKSQLEKLKEEKQTLSRINPDSPEYRTKCKQVYKEITKPRNYSELSRIEKNPEECFKTLPIYNERRCKAFLEYMPTISKRFRSKYPDLILEHIVCNLHAHPTSTMPDAMFITDGQLSSTLTTIGVALFILDELKENQTLYEALLYLPETDDELDEIEFPTYFTDSVFPDKIVKSMVFLIKNRDNEHDTYLNHTTVKRTAETVGKLYDISTGITESDFEYDTDSKASKIYQAARQMSYRERMDKILSLLSSETRKKASDHFKEVYFQMLETIFDILSPFYKDIAKYHEQLLTQSRAVELIDKEIKDACAKKKKDPIINKQKPNCLLVMKPQATMGDTASYSLIHDRGPYAGHNDLYYKCDAGYDKLIEIQGKTREIEKKLGEVVYYIQNGHNHGFRYTRKFPELEPMKKLQIGCPYEIAFGYFYLLDRGDNIVWLVETASALLDIAVGYFPWATPTNMTLRNLLENDETVSPCCDIEPVEHKTISDFENRFYEKRYTDHYVWTMCNIDKVNSSDLINHNFGQIVFEMGNVVLPRTFTAYDDKPYRGLCKSGISKKNASLMQLMIETNYLMSQKPNLHLFSDNSEKIAAQNDDMKNKIERLTEELDEAKNDLCAIRKSLKEEQGRAQQIETNAELEHAELIELRELIYKIQNDVEHNEPESEKNIALPYTPKRNIVIYGGHATWLKAIRPLLINIRVIEPGTNPDGSLIKNADVVWMQSNAMPHSFYGKIMNIARSQKIPVKYFAYASAEKCARQLAEDDMNCES